MLLSSHSHPSAARSAVKDAVDRICADSKSKHCKIAYTGFWRRAADHEASNGNLPSHGDMSQLSQCPIHYCT